MQLILQQAFGLGLMGVRPEDPAAGAAGQVNRNFKERQLLPCCCAAPRRALPARPAGGVGVGFERESGWENLGMTALGVAALAAVLQGLVEQAALVDYWEAFRKAVEAFLG